MERAFGDNLFDCLAVVLSHFEYPTIDDATQAKVAAMRSADEKKLEWRGILANYFPAAERRFGQNKNMVFCLDSSVLLKDDETLRQQAGSAGRVAGGHAEMNIRLKEFSDLQIKALMNQVVARAKTGKCFSQTLAATQVEKGPDRL